MTPLSQQDGLCSDSDFVRVRTGPLLRSATQAGPHSEGAGSRWPRLRERRRTGLARGGLLSHPIPETHTIASRRKGLPARAEPMRPRRLRRDRRRWPRDPKRPYLPEVLPPLTQRGVPDPGPERPQYLSFKSRFPVAIAQAVVGERHLGAVVNHETQPLGIVLLYDHRYHPRRRECPLLQGGMTGYTQEECWEEPQHR